MAVFKFKVVFCMLALVMLSQVGLGQSKSDFEENIYYRITSELDGESTSLDIVNDGVNNGLTLSKTGNFSGQFWKFTVKGDHLYNLSTEWQGPDKVMDYKESNSQSIPFLVDKLHYGTEVWSITSTNDGFYKISSFAFEDLFLEAVKDGDNNKIRLNKLNSNKGQRWKIIKIPASQRFTPVIVNENLTLEKNYDVPTSSNSRTKANRGTINKYELNRGESLEKGQSIVSEDKSYELVFRENGNLVLYNESGTPNWDTKTAGIGYSCKLNKDGNLVICDKNNEEVWTSNLDYSYDSDYNRKMKPIKLTISKYGSCRLIGSSGNTQWTNDDEFYGNSKYTNPDISEKKELKIGNQLWMPKNLDVTTYSDGTSIPEVGDMKEWQNLKIGAWCYYENNSQNGKVYGKLYNGYAIMGIYNEESLKDPSKRKKLAPSGWKIPSKDDWLALEKTLSGTTDSSGGKLKEAGFEHWYGPNIIASNKTGFTALPSGSRDSSGLFSGMGYYTSFWSTTEEHEGQYYSLSLTTNDCFFNDSRTYLSEATPVRCLKD